MSDTESEGSDIEVELSEPSYGETEDDASSSESESDESDNEVDKNEVKIKPNIIDDAGGSKAQKPIVLDTNDSEQEDEHEAEEDEDDIQPTLEQQAQRREDNIRALLDGDLEIHRKPQDWNSKTDYSCRYILTNFEPFLIRQILELYVVCFNLSS